MRVRATVAYDGGPFHGFAVNLDIRSVAGDLNDALSRIVGTDVVVTCAGRTDRGVHAVGQVISFDVPNDTDLDRVRRSVNGLCGPSVAIRDLERTDDDFDARFGATGRTYRYRVLNRRDPDPFLASTAWHVTDPLDVSAMQSAADHLVGEHDFTSFCKRRKVAPGTVEPTLVRRIESAEWRRPDDEGLLEFVIAGRAFCHQMVRSIVGTLVEVGRGLRPAADLPVVLAAKDRRAAASPAPPRGLVLWSVRYPDA
ncbi:MAG: tRNA pseudouridine(38-40) synthase TruA [Actinobacteria bacterium]|nr:tRNA pseudouridine(38-40) synthase TruA [Actinomycetota bacterium]